MCRWLLLFCFLLSVASEASTEIPLGSDVRKLSISGINTELKIRPATSSKSLKLAVKKSIPGNVSSDIKEANEAWSVRWEKKGEVLLIKVDAPSDKRLWREYTQKGGWPKFTLLIQSPAMPLEVFTRKGDISIENWKGKITATALSGVMNIKDSEGDLNLSLQSGQMNLANHQGSVEIENFSSKTVVSGLKGDLVLNNFDGSTLVTKAEGGLNLQAHRGAVKVSESKGRLIFESGDNSTIIERFDGSIKGESGQGDIRVTSSGKINVNLKSNQGAINVRAQGSGASVNVGTKEGGLYLPSYFKLTRYANMKVMAGRLRGGSSGRVYVRTESGNVRVR